VIRNQLRDKYISVFVQNLTYNKNDDGGYGEVNGVGEDVEVHFRKFLI
jgi:hypothetical protein